MFILSNKCVCMIMFCFVQSEHALSVTCKEASRSRKPNLTWVVQQRWMSCLFTGYLSYPQFVNLWWMYSCISLKKTPPSLECACSVQPLLQMLIILWMERKFFMSRAQSGSSSKYSYEICIRLSLSSTNSFERSLCVWICKSCFCLFQMFIQNFTVPSLSNLVVTHENFFFSFPETLWWKSCSNRTTRRRV